MKKSIIASLRELLLDPFRKKAEAENILARIFRDIMMASGMSPAEWDRRMDRYFKRVYGTDVKKINQEKTNLTRALAKNKLSWRRYETALQVMGPKSYKHTVELEFEDEQILKSVVKVRNKFDITPEPDEDEKEYEHNEEMKDVGDEDDQF